MSTNIPRVRHGAASSTITLGFGYDFTWSELESSPVAALSEVGGRIFFFLLFGGRIGDSS
jgi:uncharacterized protein YhjY with autotransporter beta-barrel domain